MTRTPDGSFSPPSQPGLHPVKAVREMMHVPRQWVRDGLREVVRGGAREFAPACAGIPAHLAGRKMAIAVLQVLLLSSLYKRLYMLFQVPIGIPSGYVCI